MSTDSKSDKIREFMNNNPGATAADISEAMQKERITVSKPLIYKLLSDQKKKPGRSKHKSTPDTDAVSMTALIETKKLVNQLGSIEEVQRAVRLLTKLKI